MLDVCFLELVWRKKSRCVVYVSVAISCRGYFCVVSELFLRERV